MKYDVFISYSRQDQATADHLCKALDEAGVSYWIDREIHGSANFLSEITRYIKQCQAMIFIASAHSAVSEFTQKEILFALKHHKTIIPYRIGKFCFENNDELDFVFTNVQWKEREEDVIASLDKLGLVPKKEQHPESLKKRSWKWLRISVVAVLGSILLSGVVWLWEPWIERFDHDEFRGTGTLNGYDYVDLGLSVKWATCNVGALTPSEYGDYYGWGEISLKSGNWKLNSTTYGQSMDDISGSPLYDVARANWGGSWRLPTNAECQELCECIWTWGYYSGKIGYKVTGPNGNSIFLPAAGFLNGVLFGRAGEYGFYWSSTPYEGWKECAYHLYFDSDERDVTWYDRESGYSLRPVISDEDIATQETYKVGDYYNVNGKEGVVFSVDATGRHGKIVSMTQSSKELQWSSNESERNRLIGASSETDGAANMRAVQQRPNWRADYPAFAWCANLGSGWYLPAIEELKLFTLNDSVHDAVNRTLAAKGGTRLYNKGEDKWYWSSTEENRQYSGYFCAWRVLMYGGYTASSYKSDDYYVRAVSAF